MRLLPARLPTWASPAACGQDPVQRLNLQTFLTVLLRRVQEDSHPDDFVALFYEQAIGNDWSLTVLSGEWNAKRCIHGVECPHPEAEQCRDDSG